MDKIGKENRGWFILSHIPALSRQPLCLSPTLSRATRNSSGLFGGLNDHMIYMYALQVKRCNIDITVIKLFCFFFFFSVEKNFIEARIKSFLQPTTVKFHRSLANFIIRNLSETDHKANITFTKQCFTFLT